MKSRIAALTLASVVVCLNASLTVAQVSFTGPTSYNAGDQVRIVAVLNTSDPNENGEGEPLVIQGSTGFSATDPFYAVPQGYFFIAPAAGTLSAFIAGADGDETGSVTVSIAPSNCPTTVPTPVPTPAGCPVQVFNKQQKDALSSITLSTGLLSLGVFAAGSVCTFATGGLCGALILGGSALGGLSLYTGFIASVDPSDSNFMVIAQPVIPTFTLLTAGNGTTQAEADSFNALMSNVAQQTAYLRVIITSVNRAQGAADAGNAFWETSQIQAALNYAGTLGSLFGAEPALLTNFQNALSSAGHQVDLTPSLIFQTESTLAFTGLPASLVQALTQFGYTSAEIDQIRQILQVQDINVASGSFPGILTNSQLISTLQQVSQAFFTPFASFNVAQLEIRTSTGTFQIGPQTKFTLGASSNGINPVKEAVTLQLGTFSVTVPGGSFKKTSTGSFVYQGTIGHVSLQIKITPINSNSYTLAAEGAGASLNGLTNPVTVGLTIGNDGGVKTTNAEFQ